MTEPADPVSALIRRWQAGWRLARGLPPAEETPGALRFLFREPGRHLEVIALHADQDPAMLRDLAADVAGASRADWLTVPTNRPEAVRAILHEAGLESFDGSGWFMTADLRGQPRYPLAPPYSITTTADGPLVEAEVHHPAGELAARGTMAVVGADAVAHDINTFRGHRRLGVASAVMSALRDEAAGRGATTGLLVASSAGRRLYSTLGWTTRAAVLTARTPGTDAR